MFINKKKHLSEEDNRLAELQYLTEQVLYDLKKEYRRAIANNLFDKAIKIKKEIEKVEHAK